MISDLRTYKKKSFFEKGHIMRLWKRLKNRKLTKFKGDTLKRSEDLLQKLLTNFCTPRGTNLAPKILRSVHFGDFKVSTNNV